MEILTGYSVFQWIASWANPVCDILFRAATDLGYHTFYYLVLAPLFWVADRRRAGVLFLLILASGLLNTTAKLLIHTPRPDPQFARVLDFRPYRSGSNAFPSGHAQNAVVFWTSLAWWVRRRWFSVLAAGLTAMISFSRLYLGVHFPIDVVGGLALGAVVMIVLPPMLERWSRAGFYMSRGATMAAAGSSFALAIATTDFTLAALGGTLLGFLAAVVWLPQSPPISGSRGLALAAIVSGLVLLAGLCAGFDAFPTAVPVFVYARVALLWIAALWAYPRAISRIVLTRPVPAQAQ